MNGVDHQLLCATIEPLEQRRLLAADFAVRVNFSTESAPTAKGYKLDYGAEYGRRGNGLTYGWSSAKSGDASYQQSKYNTPYGDSHIDVDSGDTWSINVPNGWYTVRALTGDPTTLDGDYRLNVDGQPLVKGKPYPGFPFIEGIATLRVTDGKLTVASAPRAENNRLCTISIVATDAPVPTPKGVSIDWSENRSVKSPVARVEASIVRTGSKIIVMGGFDEQYYGTTRRVDVLDTNTGQWTRLADLPGAQTHMAAASDGRYVYIAGGQSGPLLSDDLTADVWRLDLNTNKWQRFGALPEIRAGATMQILRNELHLIGGNDHTRVISQSTHLVLDLDNPNAGWREAAPLPVATDHHTSIVVNGDLYVLGGETDHGTSYFARSDFFRYNMGADTWTRLPDMPMGMSHQEAATLTDGTRIIVLAGQTDVQQMTANVYSYDIAKERWVQHTSLPNARKGGVAYLKDDSIFYFAGDDEKYGQPTWAYEGKIG